MSHVTRQELAEVIAEKTLHTTDRQKLVSGVAAYFAGTHTAVDMNSLMRDIMQYRLEQGYVEALAVSAHELPKNVLDDIVLLLKEHFPTATQFRVDGVVDQSVVGGVRIELPQETLDLSVKSKLYLFKRLTAEEK